MGEVAVVAVESSSRRPHFESAPPEAAEAIEIEVLEMPAVGPRRGPPILFVHGMFHGAWCWQEHFMPFFSRHGYDTFALSLRDHGKSTRTDTAGSWRLADYVADARSTLRRIGRKPILIGHSLGASVVQKLIEAEAFPAAALLAPAPTGGSNAAALKMLRKRPVAMARMVARKSLREAFPAFLDSFFSPGVAKADLDRYRSLLDGVTSFRAAEDAYYKDVAEPKPGRTPFLVVAGAHDWSIPPVKNETLAKAWGGEVRTVPTAHDVMLDVEWKMAADTVLEWLREAVPQRS
jgi:pimeloyl-ACP methyl ester carboxylesterase